MHTILCQVMSVQRFPGYGTSHFTIRMLIFVHSMLAAAQRMQHAERHTRRSRQTLQMHYMEHCLLAVLL